MATLKEAIQFAQKNPSDPKSFQLVQGLKSGAFDEIAAKEGVDLTQFKSKFGSQQAHQNFTGESSSVEERQGFGTLLKFKEQAAKGLVELTAPIRGAVKGVSETALKGSELVQAGLEKVTTPITGGREGFEELPKLSESEILERKGAGEKIGAFLGDVALTAVPLGGASKLTKASGLLKTAATQAGVGAALGAAKSGEFGSESLTEGVVAGALPISVAALKSVFKPIFGKAKLIMNSTGLTRSVATKADDIAQSKITIDGVEQKAFDGIDDFLVDEGFFKRGFQTTREDILEHAEDLFKKTTESKTSLLNNIKEKTNPKDIPKLKDLVKRLKEQYNVLGQEEALTKINNISEKKYLSAVDLDDIRSLADDLLPRGAFSGAEPIKVKGIQNAIEPLRNIIANLDKTGTIQRDNVRKRILGELLGFGKQTNPLKSAVLKDPTFNVAKNVLAGGGAAGSAALIPGLQPLAPIFAGTGIIKAVVESPGIASGIVNLISREAGQELPETVARQLAQEIQKRLPDILRGIAVDTSGDFAE